MGDMGMAWIVDSGLAARCAGVQLLAADVFA